MHTLVNIKAWPLVPSFWTLIFSHFHPGDRVKGMVTPSCHFSSCPLPFLCCPFLCSHYSSFPLFCDLCNTYAFLSPSSVLYGQIYISHFSSVMWRNFALLIFAFSFPADKMEPIKRSLLELVGVYLYNLMYLPSGGCKCMTYFWPFSEGFSYITTGHFLLNWKVQFRLVFSLFFMKIFFPIIKLLTAETSSGWKYCRKES